MERIFDFHVHIFPDPIAVRVVQDLGTQYKLKPYFDGTRAGLIAAQERAGVAGCLNCPVATRPSQVSSINDWAAQQNAWPVLSLGGIHPDFPDIAGELRRVKALGLPGIKLHPEYQGFFPDEARMEPIWRGCQELGLLVMLHAGQELGHPGPYRGTPDHIRPVLQAFPNLKLVAAHFGGWQIWESVACGLLGMPLYFDLAFVRGFLPDADLVRLVRQHGVERVLFGSDGPWRAVAEDVAWLNQLPLTDAERRLIAWDNAAAMLGLK